MILDTPSGHARVQGKWQWHDRNAVRTENPAAAAAPANKDAQLPAMIPLGHA